jgi:hypothetical protein
MESVVIICGQVGMDRVASLHTILLTHNQHRESIKVIIREPSNVARQSPIQTITTVYTERTIADRSDSHPSVSLTGVYIPKEIFVEGSVEVVCWQ